MELSDAVRGRRMVRAFARRPVPPEVVDRLLDMARRAPSAGNVQPWAFVVLEGADTARLWDVTLPADRRASFGWPALLDAPVVVVPLVSPEAYVDRYREPDKRGTGLGAGVSAWPVPYWWVDGGMAVQTLLLGAVDVGLGALFYGLFEHEDAALAALGVPEGWRALGAVAMGHPADDPGPAGRSAARPAPPLASRVHRGGWTQT
jgi:nitroreductase